MANYKTKLELTWIGKENRPKLEPHILIEDPAQSHHATFRVGDKDIFDNRLILRRHVPRPYRGRDLLDCVSAILGNLSQKSTPRLIWN